MAIDFSDYVKVSQWLEAGTPAMLVEVAAVAGSTPREAGAAMAVTGPAVAGTIGGGQLEWRGIEIARRMLGEAADRDEVDIPLGPEIGQCCGGKVRLSFRRIDASVAKELEAAALQQEQALPQVLVFGAGHTGVALANALTPLPVAVRLIDMRERLPVDLDSAVAPEIRALPEAEIGDAAPGSAFVVMTHEHSLDFLIAAEALSRGDAAYCGLIGSKTKRAVFENWLVDNGYDRAIAAKLVCPIGGSAVRDKRPEVIAALTAAEILTALAAQRERATGMNIPEGSRPARRGR